MPTEPPQRRQIREPWTRTLDAIVHAPGITGACLVTRDGLCVLSQSDKLRRPETFAAMAAALLSAAEVMVAEMGPRDPAIFQITAPKVRIAGMAATDELMIVVIGTPEADLEGALANVRGLPSE